LFEKLDRTSVERNTKKILPHNKRKNKVLWGRNHGLLKAGFGQAGCLPYKPTLQIHHKFEKKENR
jgi:hypothetical protein